MQRLFSVLLLAVLSIAAFGQRRFVVIDVETGVPIRGVNVMSSAHRADTTDWQGTVAVPDSCRTLSLTHVEYESRLLNTDEVGDTIFLISRLMGVREVVVFGRGQGEDRLKELKKQLRMNKTEMELASADPSRGMNVLALVQMVARRLFKRKESRKERFRKTIEAY